MAEKSTIEPYPSAQRLLALQQQAQAEGKICVVGAIICNEHGQIFVQKRSAQRRLFPNCWDLVGGHVEPGETLEEGLSREVREETGWEVTTITALLYLTDWEEDGGPRREADFLVEVRGNLEQPQLEWSKHSEFRWISANEIDTLKSGRPMYDTMVRDTIGRAFQYIQS